MSQLRLLERWSVPGSLAISELAAEFAFPLMRQIASWPKAIGRRRAHESRRARLNLLRPQKPQEYALLARCVGVLRFDRMVALNRPDAAFATRRFYQLLGLSGAGSGAIAIGVPIAQRHLYRRLDATAAERKP